MSISPKQINDHPSTTKNRRALAHLLDEYDRVRSEKEAIESRLNRFADAIQVLLKTLPDKERIEYMRRLSATKNETVSRGSETFENVVWLFQKHPNRTWTVPEVKDALESEGRPAASSKSISNAISYLERSGKLRRVGWGQYVIRNSGVGVEIDGYDDGTVRNSENFF